METKTFVASIEHLHEILHWVRSCIEPFECSSSELYKIELSVEEVVVNIIRHSYKKTQGTIDVSVKADKERIEIAISDAGEPFNPLVSRGRKKPMLSLEESQVGGVGLLLIRKCLDEVSYERKNHRNILTLIKKIRHGFSR